MKNNPKGIMYLNLNIPIIITSDGKIDLEEIAKCNFNPPIFLLGEVPTLREVLGGIIILGTVFYSTIKAK